MDAYLIILAVAELAWLYCLIAHLKAKDIDPTDKICWTVVLCVLNLFGLLLFIFLSPKSKTESVFENEERIKKEANEGKL